MEGSEREKVGGKQNVNVVILGERSFGQNSHGAPPRQHFRLFEVSLSSSEIT